MAGIICAALTAFQENGRIDPDGNRALMEYLIRNRLDGILVMGSTGEFTGLSTADRADFFRWYAREAAGRTKLMAGTGCMNEKDTIRLSNQALEAGFDAVAVISPYYYALDQEKLFLYYRTVADQIHGDVLIYNFPARSGSSVAPETLGRLMETCGNIVGIKDTVPDLPHVVACCRAAAARGGRVYSGLDDQLPGNLAAGGSGCITGLANLIPDVWHSWFEAVRTGDMGKCRKLYSLILRLMPLYAMDSNISHLFKHLLCHRGLEISTTSIFPFNQIEASVVVKAADTLDAVLRDYETIIHEEA